MSAADYRSAAARVRQELPELDRVAARAAKAWQAATHDTDGFLLDAAALNLHGFYAGLERLFVVIAERIDGSLPTGGTWHQDLLRQMTAELPGVRPAILTSDLYPTLDRYRGFRHVVRNVYAYVLDPTLVGALIDVLPQTARQVREELQRSAETLEAIAASAES